MLAPVGAGCHCCIGKGVAAYSLLCSWPARGREGGPLLCFTRCCEWNRAVWVRVLEITRVVVALLFAGGDGEGPPRVLCTASVRAVA